MRDIHEWGRDAVWCMDYWVFCLLKCNFSLCPSTCAKADGIFSVGSRSCWVYRTFYYSVNSIKWKKCKLNVKKKCNNLFVKNLTNLM